MTLCLLTIFLALNVINSGRKGLKLWRRETERAWLQECDQNGVSRQELLEAGEDPDSAYETPEMSYREREDLRRHAHEVGEGRQRSFRAKSLGAALFVRGDVCFDPPETESPPENEEGQGEDDGEDDEDAAGESSSTTNSNSGRAEGLRRGAEESAAKLAHRIMAMAERGEDVDDHPPRLRIRRQSSIVREDFHRSEAKALPWKKILLCFFVLASLLVSKVIQNTQAKCSTGYWGLFALPFLVCIGVVIPWATHLRRQHLIKVDANYHFHVGDIRWGGGGREEHQALCYPPIVFFAGVLAG